MIPITFQRKEVKSKEIDPEVVSHFDNCGLTNQSTSCFALIGQL